MKRYECLSYCLFTTSLGIMGIMWNTEGVVRLQLPEKDPKATRKNLLLHSRVRAEEVSKDPQIGKVIQKIQTHLAGKSQDLQDISLDLSSVTPFQNRVYLKTRLIPPGHTKTYGEIARAIGSPQASRAVGRALGQNPFGLLVPCHRVVAANGKPGGFSAFGGLSTKEKMLHLEGCPLGKSLE